MSILQMPGESRKAVRNALRKHARCAEILLSYGVEYVNNLSNAALIEGCRTCGIDAAAIVASVLASPGVVATAAAIAGATPDAYPLPDAPVTVWPTKQDYAEAMGDKDAKPEDSEPEDAPVSDPATVIAEEAAALRRELASAMVEGNFDAVNAKLGALIGEARKPAEIIIRDPSAVVPAGVHVAKPVSRSTWGALFGVTGTHGAKPCRVWDSPEAPLIDPLYRWPEPATLSALCALGRGQHPWLYGPPGTGKTTFAEQLAARLGRPFRTISCDDTTEAPELVGMRGPHDGRTVWLDGILAGALRIPGCVILIDEPTLARAGAIMVMQSVLQQRYLFVKETGEKIVAAPGIMFLAADNTNGTGGGAAAGFEDTRRMNAAFLDRFAVKLRIDYMPPAVEASVIVDRAACTPELATLLVNTAIVTRTQASDGKLNGALGLRRLVAWAGQLTDGIDPRIAFDNCVLNGAPEEDHETLLQLCLLAFDPSAIGPALAGQAAATAAHVQPGDTARERAAQAQFSNS